MNVLPISDAYITQAKTNYDAEAKKTDSLLDMLNSAKDKQDDAELMSACKEFESYFIGFLFKEMRKSSADLSAGLFAKSNAEKIFTDMLDEQVAEEAADSGGMGLAEFMYNQMKRQGM